MTLPVKATRELVTALEAQLKALPVQADVDALTAHHFAKGVYVRELVIPAGFCCVGKIHKEEHLNVLLKGSIAVLTEHGVKRIDAPAVIKSMPGIKRAGYAFTDVVWLTIHPNPDNETDMQVLEDRYIAPNFDDFPESLPDEITKRIEGLQ